MEREVDNQVAAPAETRTPNLHRAKTSLIKECGWKGGDSGNSAGEKHLVQRKNERTHLTPTGLLMEGDHNNNPGSMSVMAPVMRDVQSLRGLWFQPARLSSRTVSHRLLSFSRWSSETLMMERTGAMLIIQQPFRLVIQLPLIAYLHCGFSPAVSRH